MRQRRADARPGKAFGLGADARLAAGLGGHLHVHAVHERAKARIERTARLWQIDGDLAHHAPRLSGENQQAVAHLHCLFDVVRHQQHRLDRQLPLAPQVEEVVAQRFGRQHIESGKRLIHEQDVGMNHQRAREAHPLAHAAGELARIGGLEAVEADEVDRLQRAPAHLRHRHAEGFEAELHVLQHRQPREQRKALEHHRDTRGRAGHRVAEIIHHARRGLVEPGDRAQQRRFAGTGAPQETHDLPRPQREIDVLEHDELVPVGLAEGLAAALHVEQWREIQRRGGDVHGILLT